MTGGILEYKVILDFIIGFHRGECFERSRKLDEKLRKFRLYQNIRDAIGGRYYRK